jgi:hypothetical protein
VAVVAVHKARAGEGVGGELIFLARWHNLPAANNIQALPKYLGVTDRMGKIYQE